MIEVAVIIATLGVLLFLLVSVGLPAAKAKVARINCYNYLRSIGVACRLWATDNGDRFPPRVSTNEGGSMEYGSSAYDHWYVARNELGTPRVLLCPQDTRSWATNFASARNTNLSYFISLDATEYRSEMILAGDRNLTLDGAQTAPGLVALTNGQTLSWDQELHGGRGNLLFTDGRAVSVSRLWLTTNHLATNLVNRLAVP